MEEEISIWIEPKHDLPRLGDKIKWSLSFWLRNYSVSVDDVEKVVDMLTDVVNKEVLEYSKVVVDGKVIEIPVENLSRAEVRVKVRIDGDKLKLVDKPEVVWHVPITCK